MKKYREIEECIDIIFSPDYEREELRIDPDFKLIRFFVTKNESGYHVKVFGFEYGTYGDEKGIDKQELYSIFDHCYMSYVLETESNDTPMIFAVHFEVKIHGERYLVNKEMRSETFPLSKAMQFFMTSIETLFENDQSNRHEKSS